MSLCVLPFIRQAFKLKLPVTFCRPLGYGCRLYVAVVDAFRCRSVNWAQLVDETGALNRGGLALNFMSSSLFCVTLS